jgi:hypothetical protein
MKKPSWRKLARTVLGKKAIQNIGDGSDGQFAFVTPCIDQIDLFLWATREGAVKMKARVDRVGCCGGCNPRTHYLVDLRKAK